MGPSMNRRSPYVKVLATLLLALILLGSTPAVRANTGTVVFTYGSPLDDGDSISTYTLYYNVPPTFQAGVPTNMSFYIYITGLTGWIVHDTSISLEVTANTPNEPNTVFSQKFWDNQTLFQGYRWGPFNMTVDLSPSQVGLSPGQSATLSFFGSFVADEQWNDPRAPYLLPTGSTMAIPGNYTITAPTSTSAPSSSQRTLTTLGVGLGVIAVLTVVALATRKRGQN